MQIQNEQVLNKAYHDVFLKKKKNPDVDASGALTTIWVTKL